jgi:hypothetical protein
LPSYLGTTEQWLLLLLNYGLIKTMEQITKAKAIEMLGGTSKSAAQAIGCTVQAVNKWPEVLPPRIADRVVAAKTRLRARKRKPVAEGV